MNAYTPTVYLDEHARPLIVLGKARIKYYAVAARDADIAVVKLDTLRSLREAMHDGKPYPPRKCASYWLNHDFREITGRAKMVLRGLVARKKTEAATA